jgi:hypothetical protein
MKVYLSNYRNHWLSPYTILEKVFFWREIDYDEPKIDRLANILEPFCQALFKFLEIVHPRINYVKIDKWDTWSMDHTLSYIILPMLKQLKETNHGYSIVDLEDVPVELRGTTHEEYESQLYFDWYHDKQFEDLGSARWDWVMNEMIWTFEQLVNDTDEQFFINGYDREGLKRHETRMANGFRLFGKYYRGLWD